MQQFDAVPLAPATKAEVTKSEVKKSEVEDDLISIAMEDDPDEEDDVENDGDDDEDFEMVDGLFVDRSFDACKESIGVSSAHQPPGVRPSPPYNLPKLFLPRMIRSTRWTLRRRHTLPGRRLLSDMSTCRAVVY